jgi:hypothetical protein
MKGRRDKGMIGWSVEGLASRSWVPDVRLGVFCLSNGCPRTRQTIGLVEAMHLYFSDESGDPGLAGGSSPLFAVCLLRVDPTVARSIRATLGDIRTRLSLPADFEFKWARNHPRVRQAALEAIGREQLEFRIRIWAKRAGLPMRARPIDLEVSLLRSCMGDFGPPWPPAKLTLDGSPDRARAARVRMGLADCLSDDGLPCLREVRIQDSKDSDLLQVADLLAGFAVRSLSDSKVDRDILSMVSSLGGWRHWP